MCSSNTLSTIYFMRDAPYLHILTGVLTINFLVDIVTTLLLFLLGKAKNTLARNEDHTTSVQRRPIKMRATILYLGNR